MEFTIVITIGLIFVLSVFAVWIKLLKICPANEVFVISGGRHTDPTGQPCGYKIIKGGKVMILPLFERLDRLDLTNMIIEVRVMGAYSKGGIPLNVQGVANVKVPGQGPGLANAVVRLLGKERVEIQTIAKETLEGNLRGVMAQLTPEQLNEDKIKFAKILIEEADDDLIRLGLVLDTLKIQNVWDDVGYLNSIGRIRNADVQKKARVAEAQNEALSKIRSAENKQETELARIEAQTRTLQAQITQEIADAVTGKDVLVAKEKGNVAAMVAKAHADLEVQKARVEQVRRKLQADVVEPARAQLEEAVSDARGQAARITEDGRATAEALKEIAERWQQSGDNARDAFLYTKLENLMHIVMETMGQLKVERLTVLPSSGSNGPAGQGGGNLAANLYKFNEELKATLGVDISKALPQDTLAPPPSDA
jgi:flotillin